MNNHLPIRASLAIFLFTTLTGCGTATLHETWDSELEPNVEQTISDIRALTSDCEEMEDTWEPAWVTFEMQVLELTNQRRAQGADCNTKGVFPSVSPLTWNSQLACAARTHSSDMAAREFFDHTNPDGTTPAMRVVSTGYSFQTVGENIAAGQITPEHVVDGWMSSDGHCANIMKASYKELGVGYVEDPATPYRFYWTQVFGTAYPSNSEF